MILSGQRVHLGSRRGFQNPTGGTYAAVEALPKRPDVVAEDGTVYEVVWYPHRDAPSLLPFDVRWRPDSAMRVALRASR